MTTTDFIPAAKRPKLYIFQNITPYFEGRNEPCVFKSLQAVDFRIKHLNYVVTSRRLYFEELYQTLFKNYFQIFKGEMRHSI